MVETTAINNILRWIKYWDDKSKITLINRISTEMLNQEVQKEDPLEVTFGAWETDKSAEELAQNIRSSRTFRERNIESIKIEH